MRCGLIFFCKYMWIVDLVYTDDWISFSSYLLHMVEGHRHLVHRATVKVNNNLQEARAKGLQASNNKHRDKRGTQRLRISIPLVADSHLNREDSHLEQVLDQLACHQVHNKHLLPLSRKPPNCNRYRNEIKILLHEFLNSKSLVVI